ncbi:MAG: hypothetical protein AAB531_01925 [Patescibacteria group bacterium]
MSGEHELESRVHQYLATQRQEEKSKRFDLIWEVGKVIGTDKLPGEFPQEFFEQLEQTPLDWQIDFSEEGLRFKRDFPYESVFYGMQGWDAARIVINLDVAKSAVAFRAHLFDAEADMRIDEGILIKEKNVVSFEREMIGWGPYRPVLEEIHRELESTKGKCGSLFDHSQPAFSDLPDLIKELCGDSYGRFLENFVRRVNEGEIDIDTMPRLSLGWPVLSPYNKAEE